MQIILNCELLFKEISNNLQLFISIYIEICHLFEQMKRIKSEMVIDFRLGIKYNPWNDMELVELSILLKAIFIWEIKLYIFFAIEKFYKKFTIYI